MMPIELNEWPSNTATRSSHLSNWIAYKYNIRCGKCLKLGQIILQTRVYNVGKSEMSIRNLTLLNQ